MMLQGAIGPQSFVIIQSEITDSESNVWLHLEVYKHVFPSYTSRYSVRSKSENTSYRKYLVFFPFQMVFNDIIK